MAQSTDRKILRIGIIQNGKIIEERLLRKRETVTIGQGTKNTFVLPSAGIPKNFSLFELKGGVYHLVFRQNMRGKVSVGDAVLDLEALREQKIAQKKGDAFVLALSEKSRGKVVVDDITLLFQFVTPPPPASQLQLPASARGGWLKSIDWPFASILMASCVFQVFGTAFIVTRDYPEPPKGIESLPDRFVKLLVDKPEEAVKAKKENGEEGDEKGEDKGEKPKEPPKKETAKPKAEPKVTVEANPQPTRPLTPEEVAAANAARREVATKRVQSETILKFIGTQGGDGPGAIVDTLKDGAADVAIANAFDGASGVVVANNETQARDRRERVVQGTGQVAGIKTEDLERKGGGPVTTGSKGEEVAVKGNVTVKEPSEAFGTGTLDPSSIGTVVSRRKGAVKSCYEKQLKKNPKLAGKVKVQFTIEESGRVGAVKVLEDTTDDPEVGKCIASAIGRWKFPSPEGGSVTVAFPFVFAPAE